MNNKYYIVAVTPTTQGALYCGDTLSLTGTIPQGYEDAEEIDFYSAGWNPTEDPEQTGLTPAELLAKVDAELGGLWSGKMAVTLRAQGKYIEKNHPAFMTVEE